MTKNSTSPCAGGKCVPFKGSLSGVCAYTPPKYDKKSDKTTGDVTTCERFKDLPGAFPAQGDVTQSYVKCSGNGEVVLPFGAAEYVGLGFIVFMFLVFTEIFGSPFVRNCQVYMCVWRACVHVYLFLCKKVEMIVGGYARRSICTFVLMYACVLLYYTNTHMSCSSVCMCLSVRACMCICIGIYVGIYTHT